MLCGGLFNIVTGFMEAQVNLQGGSRWSPEDLFIKLPSPVLTVVSDSVVEKVGAQMYFVFCHHCHHSPPPPHHHHHHPFYS
jgi:hypothetical protein